MFLEVGASLSKLAKKPLVLDRLEPQHHIAGRGLTSLAADSVGTVGENFADCLVGTATPIRCRCQVF